MTTTTHNSKHGQVAQARAEFLALVLQPTAPAAAICGRDEQAATATPSLNSEATDGLTADYDEVFERASDAVAHLRFPDVSEDADATLSVVEFIDTALDGLQLWRWSDEVQDVTDMVMLWQDELVITAPHFAGQLEALVGIAVEIALVRGCFYWADINFQLANMSADDLTTGNAELDAWLIEYGKAMTDTSDDDSDSCTGHPNAETVARRGTLEGLS